ncbi:MAG: lipid asymmetry maintenance protein MlaB [Betaproteobacteria bacterium]
MSPIRLTFSERLDLHNAMAELGVHQRSLDVVGRQPQPTAPKSIVADLSGLREVDTAALAVLLELNRETRRRFGKPLVVASAPRQLRALAELTSVDRLMTWQA